MSTVVWRADARLHGERRQLARDPRMLDWLAEHGIDGHRTYAVEILADGDGQVVAYQYDEDERGKFYVVGDLIATRDPVVVPLRSVPPEFTALQ